jgi:hypothetical protein
LQVSPVVHALSSSQLAPTFGVLTQPLAVQASVVQGLSSSQALSFRALTQPLVGLHESWVQLTPSLQFRGVVPG